VSGHCYLPVKRLPRRSFAGRANGSLAAQLENLFTTEIIMRSDFGIDIHSAALHRVNLPQIRFNSDNPETIESAKLFGAPIVMDAPLREGSLRMAAKEHGTDVLLYEAGEALRFDEFAIRVGLKGILNVLKHKGMIGGRLISSAKRPSVSVQGSRWVRSPVGGVFRTHTAIGAKVSKGDILGYVSDPFGDEDREIEAHSNGIIIGRTHLPFVNPGDALFHIGNVRALKSAERNMEAIEKDIEFDPLFDEDEII